MFEVDRSSIAGFASIFYCNVKKERYPLVKRIMSLNSLKNHNTMLVCKAMFLINYTLISHIKIEIKNAFKSQFHNKIKIISADPLLKIM